MPTSVDGDVADGDLSAEFQGDGFVASTDTATFQVSACLRILVRQSLAVNQSMTGDGDVGLSFSPDKRVVEISMAAVLVFWETAKRLTLVVGLHRCRCSEDDGTSGEVQIDIALQADAAAEVRTGRQ